MTSFTEYELPVIFSHADAARLGISDRQLYASRDAGFIETLARGIYMQAGLHGDLDLLEIAFRAPIATLCLSTALVRHGLTDDIPALINVALPRDRRAPRCSAPITWHRFDHETFDIDRTEVDVIPGYQIGLYGPKRCIVDAFRLRHLYGTDQAISALRRWLRSPAAHPSDLLDIAQNFPVVEAPLHQALEYLL